ncbi:hypothetical protein [Pelagibius marinus]|uniref:hypothetical protein n=1 Tax=Pelagibius marinus TaxID=2762760 RepID=UPI0018729306|nr:hypothetical protein [Pelagibius marinus]
MLGDLFWTDKGEEHPMVDTSTDYQVVARDLAWKWFEYHAGQRLAVFRFFLLVIAFISAGYVSSLLAKEHLVSGILALVLLVSTFLFYRLDRRNRALVKISEAYLKDDQAELAQQLGKSGIKLIEISDDEKEYRSLCSFSQINKAIFALVGAFGAVGLIISALKSCW